MERILLLRFSSLGDVVLTAPVVKALRREYPQAQIDFLVQARYAPVVRAFNPVPDQIIPFPAIGAAQLPAFARGLSRQPYDLLIDLHDSLRSKLLRRLISARAKRVYRKPRLKRWLLFYLWLDRFAADFSVAGEYLRYAGLTADPADARPRMAIPAQELAAVQAKFGLERPYFAMVPGAAWSQKIWPEERYRDLLGRLQEHPGIRLVMLGGDADAVCDRIAVHFPAGALVNLKGRTSLEESLAVLAGARAVLGADTGLVHAAEALGVPVVMIQGPTSWQTGARVHDERSVVHQSPLWCRPCSQNGSRPCYRRERYCLTGTQAGAVSESLLRLWEPAA